MARYLLHGNVFVSGTRARAAMRDGRRMLRAVLLLSFAAMSGLLSGHNASAQCTHTYVAVPLNVQQTYTFVTDSTNSRIFAATACDPNARGVFDTAAHAMLAEQAEEGPIPSSQITGAIFGTFYVGGTPGAEYIQYTPTSNPGYAYGNTITYYTNSALLGPVLQTVVMNVAAAPLPAVTAISTAAGPTTGAISFTITGTNLIGATSVSFGGTAAASFTVNSATSITVTSPAHAAGQVDITVTTPNGTSATSSDDEFTFVTPPAITSLTPTSGTTSGGTVVTLTGTNLSNATQILFNGAAGTSISSTATSATVTTPAHASGQVDVTLVTSGGTSALTSGDHYTFIAPPTAGASSATVAYNSSANAITLNTLGGPTSVAIATAPGHGTATASGTSITYTPTIGFFGSDSFTYTAANSAGASSAATVTITVNGPTINVTPTTLTAGTFGTAYSQTLSASGGQSPYTFSTTLASGALPAGLSLSSAGVVSGTPTAAGTFTFAVSGTDSSTNTHASFTSTSISLTIAPIAPGAPTIGTATAGNAQASVAVTAPVSNGGAAVTSYTVISSPGGFTGTGASSPIVVAGLTNGTSYTFTVTATNSVGIGPASSASNSVTPIGSPVAGASSVTVAYNSSSNTVALSLSGGTPTSVAVVSAASHGAATASGTTITYTPATGFFGSDSFTYTATNGFGTSSAATVSVTVVAPAIAVTPTTLGSGVTLTAYSQTLTANGGKAPYTFSTTLASGTLPTGMSLSATGVVSGTPLAVGTYTFTVSGTDSSTLTHASFISGTITLVINSAVPLAPGAPTIGTATAGNAQATVTFTAPASNGGATITSYTVTSNPSGITASGASSPILVTGLANGTAYTLTVTATNSAGTGLPSFASNSVTPIALPIAGAASATVAYDSFANALALNLSGGAPTSVAVVSAASHGTATASGTSITYMPTTGYYGSDSFTYTATNGSGTSSAATASITISSPTISVTPVTLTSDTVGSGYSQTLSGNGGQAPYTFSTTLASGALPVGLSLSSAGNITGTPTTAGTSTFTVSGIDSSSSTHASFTSTTLSITINPILAGAPTIGTATAGDAQATVTFTAPSSNGGSAITGYIVTSSPGGITASGSASPITVTGLANGTSYTFTVTATNAAGTSSASVASNAVTPVAAPAAGASSLTVAYDSSANPVTLALSGGAPTSVAVASAASHGTASASGTSIAYTPTTGFYGSDSFTYTATNGAGTSAPTTVSITVTAPSIAVAPTTLPSGTVGTAYSNALTASGGQAPYTFSTTVASGTLPPGLILSSTGAITGTPTMIGTYTFTVTGTDSSSLTHAGFTSATITLAVTALLPGSPTIGTATAGNTQATVTFTAPLSNGGSAITGYTVTSSPGGFTATGSASPITVTGLTNGTAYTFIVTGTNSIGTGPASAASNSVTPIPPPIAGAVSATVAYDSSANPVPLNLTGGAVSSVAVASAASHGTATASGTSIIYTPTTGFYGSDSFTYTANNGSGTSSAASVSIAISAPVISVAPSTLAAGTDGTAYNQTLSAHGGQAPYTFSTALATGSLPAGVSLASTGAITGTPTTSGTYTFTVTGTDSSTATHASFTSATISLTIGALVPGAPTSGTATAGNTQASVAFTPPASNGGAPITGYTVTSSPGGITATGTASPITLSGLTNGTSYTFTITATNSVGTGPSSAPSNAVTPSASVTASQAIASTTLTQNHATTAFAPVVGGSGTAPLVYSVSPALPSGLTLSTTTGAITGTPTAVSPAATYTVTVTDANGATAMATFSLTVAAPITAAAKSVTAAYNANGTTSTAIDLTSSIIGATATSVAVATPPSHGTATASGLIVTYIPTTGFYGYDSFTYTASNASSTSSASATVSITVSAPAISTASGTLPGGAIGVAYSQPLAPNGGIAPYTLSTTVSGGTFPTGLTLSSTGVLSGTPTAACTCTFTITGTDSSTPPATFTLTLSLTIVAGAPTITSITPPVGLAAGGTAVTITGTSFSNNSTVSFGNTPATGVTYINATTLTAIAPAGTGTVDVVVTTPGGPSAISPADPFSYLAHAGALSNPLGTAVDGSGDTFIADPTLGYLVEVPAGCTSVTCELIVGGGLTGLTAVTTDGSGNLFVLSGGAYGTITEFTYDAATNTYVQQNIVATGLNLPTTAPAGVAVDDRGNLFVTDTADHTVIEEPYNNSTGTYGAPITLTTGSASSTPTGIAVDGNGDVFYADPGTGTIDELIPGSNTPIVLASGVNAQSVTVDASGNVYYSDSVSNTLTKIPFDGTSYGTPAILATGLSAPYGLSVDDSGNLLVANNATKALVKVTVDAPPSLTFASTKAGATSNDSPQRAMLANIGNAALTFPPTSAANPTLPPGYVLDSSTTCPQVFTSSASQAVAEGASCAYAIDFSPGITNLGADSGALTLTDDNLNLANAMQAVSFTATGVADDGSAVTVTLSPASPIIFGKSLAIVAAVHDTTVPSTVASGSVTFTSTDSGSTEATIATGVPLSGGSASVASFKPSAAGTYTLTGSYTGSVGNIAPGSGSVSLVVTKATPALAYEPSSATQTYGTAIPAGALDATALDANGVSIPGTFAYTTAVNSAATTLIAGTTVLPVAAYTITATFTPTDTADYASGGTVIASYAVTQSTASVILGSLNQSYNGFPRAVAATTTPAGLDMIFTYNGSLTPPVAAGSYTVVATVHNTDYAGSATGTLVIAKVPAATVLLSSSDNPVLAQNTLTLTATVSSSLSTPTGTVNFIDSGSNTFLGSGTLVGGIATLTTSTIPIGLHTLVAAYLGDTDFLPRNSSPLTETVLDFTLGLSTAPGSTTTITASPGGIANYQFALAPDGSATFTDPVTLSISGQPAGSTYTITPDTIPAGAGPTEVALSIVLPQNTATQRQDGRRLPPFVLALLLLPFAGRLRRTGKRVARALTLLTLLVVGIGVTAGLTSCGTASGFYAGNQQPPKIYTITLTGTSGMLSHSISVVLNVP